MIDEAAYTQQQDFVKSFVDTFSGNTADTTCDTPIGHATNAGDGCGNFNGEMGLKVSVMSFSSANTINIPLSTDYQAIKAATGRTQTGTTNTHLCLLAAQSMLTDPTQGARACASKVIVLLTNEVPTSQSTTLQAANAAKAAGTVVVGVGVDTGMCGGSGTCAPGPTNPGGCCSSLDNNLMALCSQPSTEYYTRIADFSGLQGKVQQISNISCSDCQSCPAGTHSSNVDPNPT
jgi:hypothetical protein